MAFPESSRQSLIPNFLYSSSARSPAIHKLLKANSSSRFSSPSPNLGSPAPVKRGFAIHSPRDSANADLNSLGYYIYNLYNALYIFGFNHTVFSPLDMIKCQLQINPGFKVLRLESLKAWSPTLMGYSAYGASKFLFYDFFKRYYSDIAGPEYATENKALINLAGFASAEVIAAIALCPFEAVKIRLQIQPFFARNMRDGFSKFVKSEGWTGLYNGIVPLWGRQIPLTMVKFASFEAFVDLLYKCVIPVPKEQLKTEGQNVVHFIGGFMAGALGAIVSHPADNLLTFLYHAKGTTAGDAMRQLGLRGLFTRALRYRICTVGLITGIECGVSCQCQIYDDDLGYPIGGRPPVYSHPF